MALEVTVCILVYNYLSVLDMGLYSVFFFQAEDGIRDLVRSRGLGDVYKRQGVTGHRFDYSCLFWR